MNANTHMSQAVQNADLEINDKGEPLCPDCSQPMASEGGGVWFCTDMKCECDQEFFVDGAGDDTPVH